MSAILSNFPTWTPSHIPTSTTLKSIPATYASGASETLASMVSLFPHVYGNDLIGLVRTARGALATLTIIENQQVLATATDTSVLASATQAIFDATLNLEDLYEDFSFYRYYLSRFGNIFYFSVFTIIFFYLTGMLYKSRYWWFNITFIAGYALEWMGFLGRILAFTDNRRKEYFLLEYISLTIAPAFIMAGIYFVFAQLVVVHGRRYSVLKPLWYSYLFITIDVLSLMIQAGGGGAASSATANNTDPKPGTDTMIAGIVIQVFGMTIFLVFWAEFLHRLYFKFTDTEKIDPKYLKFTKTSFSNFFKLLFNTKSVREYRKEVLEQNYNSKFKSIREAKLFNYFPLAITIAVIAVYIRSVYRVVELAQGFGGYLFNHEVFLFTLDAMMISICGLIFIPFHPVWILGENVVLRLATIKKGDDIESDNEKLDYEQGRIILNSDEEASQSNEDAASRNITGKSEDHSDGMISPFSNGDNTPVNTQNFPPKH